jgi:sodium-dependent phosphate cotransporter
LQVAFSCLFFNITGIFLFYVIWPTRKFPIAGAKFLGNTTAECRWFVMAHIFVAFLIIPGALVGLSIAGLAAFLVFLIPSAFVALFVAVAHFLQGNHEGKLPETLQTLEPLDRDLWSPLIVFSATAR